MWHVVVVTYVVGGTVAMFIVREWKTMDDLLRLSDLQAGL
jgi:hypothetical protein